MNMKHTINKIGVIFLILALASSCVDDTKLLFDVEKPASIAGMEYLDNYDALKSYVDRNANPDFKLGAGVTVSEYLDQGHMYRLINSNFDIMTAGNAMKYSSVVGDDGSMNFGTVTAFVDAAKAAGVQIYGHTLVWHAQQNNKYLNSLIADKKIEGAGEALDPSVITNSDFETDGSGWGGWGNNSTRGRTEAGEGFDNSYGYFFTNPSAVNSWEAQTAYDFSPLEDGATYVLSLQIRGSVDGTISAGLQDPSNYASGGDFPPLGVTQEWKEYTLEITANGENVARFLFSFGAYVGTIYIDDITLSRKNPLGGSVDIPKYLYQSDFEDGVALGGWGNGSTREVVNGELQMVNPSAVNFWEAQAAIDFADPLVNGEMYYLNLKVKGSAAGVLRPGFQDPSDYSSGGDFDNISFTTDWQEFTISTSVIKETVTRFLFSYGDFAGTIYIDDLSLYSIESANSIPLTPEEKIDTLSWAMENWIVGMMEATDGYVTEWDVVNEAISGQDADGDGFYDLQSADFVSADEAKANFYWQDYLGDDFVRIPVALAREYGPADMKLFINDYNLESDWDDNHKLKSLIQWIERWESDGVTVIDGIGTQMHVSYHLNPETQASKEEHIVKMFELMAATGKLIKITELDMGLVDEEGNAVATGDVTTEQHKAMSEHYKFIVEKYFELIPADQRYGITHWCPFDSPEESSWRGGEPVGLWSRDNYRKHTYAGFADGLAGE